MAIKSRTQIKTHFQTGDKPDQENFNDWIDSFHHKTEDTYPEGPQGPQGEKGDPGTSVLYGTNDPDNANGRNGDFWINTTANTLFGPKASGTWPTGVSLVGPSGPSGAAGADGKTVRNGAGAPSNALGVNGDFYIDTSAATLYGPKTLGAWGSGVSMIGPAGTNGSNGSNGKTVLNGTGVPSNALGTTGDFYIDTATWNIYGPKGASTWPSATSIIGPTGPQGPTGNSAIYQLPSVISAGAVTTEVTLASWTVASSSLRNGSVLETFMAFLMTASANTKTLRLYINGTEIIRAVSGSTSNTFDGIYRSRYNGSVLRQSNSISSSSNVAGTGFGASGTAITSISPDGSGNFVFSITGQKASSGETLTLENAFAKWVY